MKRNTLAVISVFSMGFMLAIGATTCWAVELLHYTFDQVISDGAATPTYTTPDSSTNAITGTLKNMTDSNLVPGRVGGALQFFGGSNSTNVTRVEVPANDATLNAAFTEFTFAALVRPNLDPTDTHPAFIAGKLGTGSTRGWQFGYELALSSANTVPFQTFASIFQAASPSNGPNIEVHSGENTALLNDVWYHLAFTFKASPDGIDPGFVRMYIDGAKTSDTPTTLIALNGANTRAFQVGQRGDGVALSGWKGLIDEVYIYNTALTDAEIAALVPPPIPVILGDFTQNGVVDANDYVTWRKNVDSLIPLPNDNGLGTPIGPAHYDLWRAHFGATSGSGSLAGGAVPEPAAALLAIAAVAGVAFRGSRRRS